MAVATLSARRSHASPARFNSALAAFRNAHRRVTARSTHSNRAAYSRSVSRLLAIPAPNVLALVAKLETVDPFDLDHFEVILGDARRLAGM